MLILKTNQKEKGQRELGGEPHKFVRHDPNANLHTGEAGLWRLQEAPHRFVRQDLDTNLHTWEAGLWRLLRQWTSHPNQTF